MRPLPRLHAVTDASVLALEDFGIRAAAIASAGPAVALHARNRSADGAALVALTRRLLAHAGPPQASVFVNGRPDIASALDAHGVQLGSEDLAPPDARVAAGAAWDGWVGRSVHDAREAELAANEGADFLFVGTIFETDSHPGRTPAGPRLITESARTGLPVIAIGGVTPARAREARDAGAYGIAVISAAWRAPDPAAATMALLAPWTDE
ncbi:MAG: thiamine phosphate synthase [Gemmatimonadota bacterium]